ncbi:hypothetical protein TSUD_57960 [Trifolium subterraneum]|uniref:Uncharacterized protein n=1 Tax=Trifolium subterraneum TaxID=3900 RepID=A0A2Z6MCH6_TRISU|nr:hypothetical protein TSUD_57960 [Trifolium subterraneum]
MSTANGHSDKEATVDRSEKRLTTATMMTITTAKVTMITTKLTTTITMTKVRGSKTGKAQLVMIKLHPMCIVEATLAATHRNAMQSFTRLKTENADTDDCNYTDGTAVQ